MRAQGGSAFGTPDWLSRVFIAGGWVDVRHNCNSSLSLSLPLLSVLLAFLLLCFILQLSVFDCYALPLATWLIVFLLWFLYPKPPWSLSVGRFVCDYSRARFSPFRTVDSS